MDTKLKIIKNILKTVSPETSTMYIKSFFLTEEEEKSILLKEVRKKSIQQIADEECVCVETVKRWRRSAFEKMANQIGA